MSPMFEVCQRTAPVVGFRANTLSISDPTYTVPFEPTAGDDLTLRPRLADQILAPVAALSAYTRLSSLPTKMLPSVAEMAGEDLTSPPVVTSMPTFTLVFSCAFADGTGVTLPCDSSSLWLRQVFGFFRCLLRSDPCSPTGSLALRPDGLLRRSLFACSGGVAPSAQVFSLPPRPTLFDHPVDCLDSVTPDIQGRRQIAGSAKWTRGATERTRRR